MTATKPVSKSGIGTAGKPSGKAGRNEPAEVFGPYEVYDRLGIGGMATVHRAKERGIEGFERIVALKRLLPHLAEDTSFVNAFVREARLASQLQHANIVQLYELGRVGQVLFISMEYIEGRDIRAILRQSRKVTGPPPMSVFLSLMSQLCDALDYAHNRVDQNGDALGIVHRDVSPSNLLVTQSGHLKVIDFGIAKAQTQPRTETGRVKGKLAYMAPEALKVQELDARSDIFSAGVVAHELLTARPLFAARNEYETLTRLQKMTVEAPSKRNRKCPPELDEIVLKALARDRERRWKSAAEMRDALHALRARYQIASTNREVSSWLEWAFALKAPQTGSFAAVSSASLSRNLSGSNTGVSPARAFARATSSITPSGGFTPPNSEDSNVAPLPPPPGGPLALEASAATAPSIAEPGDDISEAAVDYAWGEEGDKAQAPSVLEEIPDVSLDMASAPRDARAERASASVPSTEASVNSAVTYVPDGLVDSGQPAGRQLRRQAGNQSNGQTFDPDTTTPYVLAPGPGLDLDERDDDDLALTTSARLAVVAEQRRRRRVLFAGAAAILVAAAAFLLIISTSGPDSEAPAAQAPVISTAAIKFMVEPREALIRVAGHEDHSGAPYQLEVTAPGTYRVDIQYPGYRSYVTELEVDVGENHVIRLALEAAKNEKSQITVRLSRKRAVVHLDGEPLPAGNPVVAEVEPGAHILAIVDRDGDELWRQEIETAARTNYEFEPSIKRKRSRSRDRDDETDDDKSDDTNPIVADVEVDDEFDDSDIANPGTAGTQPVNLIAADLPTTKLPPAPVDKPVKQDAERKKRPITLLPHQVKKRSGSLPPIAGEDHDVPSRAGAKLCIDTRGDVVSAKLLTEMSNRARTRITNALRAWQYAPHRENGTAVPACFAVTFTIARTGR